MKRYFLGLLSVLALLLAAPGPAGAAGKTGLAAFFGNWGGTAIAKNRDSIYFGVTIRDLDVTIAGTGDGFDISWTTVFRRGGTPDKPKIRRKTTKLSFAWAGPGLYRAKGADGPGFGRNFSWGRIEGNRLLLYIFVLDDKGIYQLSSYTRTLTGSGMDLEFSAIRDGESLRTVTGRLIKHR